MRYGILCLMVLFALACSDNEANLVNANNGGDNNTANNENNENNATNNTNNGNNQNNTNNTNNQNNTTNNVGNNSTPDIYDTEPEADDRDYEGTIPMRPSGEVEGFVHDMYVAHCTRIFECRDNPNTFTRLNVNRVGTVGECVARLVAEDDPGRFADAVTNGRASFDSNVTAQCISDLEMQDCVRAAIAFDAPRSQSQACQNALTGNVGNRDACLSNADCGIGTFCNNNFADVCAGSCRNNDPSGEGCGDTTCTLDEYCNVGTMQCETWNVEGDACNDFEKCDIGFFCNEGTCSPTKFLYQEGQPCNLFSNLCAPGLWCDIGSLDDAGTCVARVGEGDECVFGDECPYDQYCNEVCIAKSDSGACTFSSDCLSDVCSSDTDMCFPTGTVCTEDISGM